MPRLFYALWPDAATRAALDRVARQVELGDGRRVAAARLHLTLAFLGAVDAPAAAALCAAGPPPAVAAPFTLVLTRCGWWRSSAVAWLAPAVVPPQLDALQRSVQARAVAAGVHPAAERFRPHVTIARRVSRAPRLPGACAVVWPVGEYTLVESSSAARGSIYRVLARWPLGGPPGAAVVPRHR